MADTSIDDGGIEELFHDPEGPVAEIMEAKAIRVENAMKELLLLPGSGRVYTTRFWRKDGKLRRGGDRPPHQASAPGEPPASDTGLLLSTINHTMEDGPNGIEGVIGSSSQVSTYLELGTRYMEPRPFERPALEIGLRE